MKGRIFVSMAVLVMGLAWVGQAGAAQVRVSAAASLKEALKEISATYSGQHPGVEVLPNFGASGTLARQIEQGAPTDLFISANPEWMDYLVERVLVSPASPFPLLSNALVLVGKKTLRVRSLEDLSSLSSLAIANPSAAPAGRYAEQALEKAGLLGGMRSRLVIAQDVRQALMYADRGEVDGALVYRTDALMARQAHIHFTLPPGLHDPVVYPATLTLAGQNNPEAQAFARYLGGEQARAVFRRFGFGEPR